MLLDNYKNRSFTLTTQISKSAKYPIRNQIKVIKGLNYESEASELNMEVEVEELSPSEADLVWKISRRFEIFNLKPSGIM